MVLVTVIAQGMALEDAEAPESLVNLSFAGTGGWDWRPAEEGPAGACGVEALLETGACSLNQN